MTWNRGLILVGVAGVLAWFVVASSVGSDDSPTAAVRDVLTTSPGPSEDTLPGDASTQGLQADPGFSRSVLDLFDADQPLFIVGEKVESVAAARGVTDGVVLAPTASRLGSPEVWVNAAAGEVGIRYPSGVVVLQTPWPNVNLKDSGGNPYDSKAKSIGAGYTTEIRGYPAFVLPANSRKGPAGLEPPVNTVQIYVDGYDVTLMSPSASVDDLVVLAASIEAEASDATP